jgi:hypothetical protein
MTTLRDIFTAFAPEYLERYPVPPQCAPQGYERHPKLP